MKNSIYFLLFILFTFKFDLIANQSIFQDGRKIRRKSLTQLMIPIVQYFAKQRKIEPLMISDPKCKSILPSFSTKNHSNVLDIALSAENASNKLKEQAEKQYNREIKKQLYDAAQEQTFVSAFNFLEAAYQVEQREDKLNCINQAAKMMKLSSQVDSWKLKEFGRNQFVIQPQTLEIWPQIRQAKQELNLID
ncbi:MAG: hypothetical protein WDZ41_00660 [Candidatus Babeliales bacterium]